MTNLITRLHCQALSYTICSTIYYEFSSVCSKILNRMDCMPPTCVPTRWYSQSSGPWKKYVSLQAEKDIYSGSYFSQKNVLITELLCKITFLFPRVLAFFCFKVVPFSAVSVTAWSVRHLLRMNPGLTPSEHLATGTWIFLSLINDKSTRWITNFAMDSRPEYCPSQMEARI